MKKQLVCVLSLLACITLGTGCASNSNDQSESTDVSNTTSITDEVLESEETAIKGTLKKNKVSTESEEIVVKPIIEGFFNATSIEKLGTQNVQLADYKKIISNYDNKITVTDDEIDSRINEEVSNSYVPSVSSETKISERSIVNIDYIVKNSDGEVLYDKKMESIDIESNTFIPEINKSIINKKAGDKFSIAAKLNNEDVTVSGEINFIEGYLEQAQFNERFIEYITKKQCKTQDEYREYIKNIIYNEKKAMQKENILNAIIEGTTFPDSINTEIEKTYNDGESYFNQYAVDCGYESFEDFINVIGYNDEDDIKNQIEEKATYYVKKMVVIFAIKEKEDIEIKNDEMNVMAQTVIEAYNYSSVDEYVANNTVEDLRNEVIGNIVLNQLMEVFG